MRKVSPTQTRVAKRPRNQLLIPRRARVPPPEIFVRLTDHVPYAAFHQAHLRNKRGYVYLCWREGKRVRNFYLGKARKPSPTRPSSAHFPAPASVSSICRARK